MNARQARKKSHAEAPKGRALLMRFQIIGHLFHGKVIGSLQCSLRSAKHLTHIFIFHIVIITQREHGALHFGQRGNGFLQKRIRTVAIKIGVGSQTAGQGKAISWLRRHTRLLPSQEV